MVDATLSLMNALHTSSHMMSLSYMSRRRFTLSFFLQISPAVISRLIWSFADLSVVYKTVYLTVILNIFDVELGYE